MGLFDTFRKKETNEANGKVTITTLKVNDKLIHEIETFEWFINCGIPYHNESFPTIQLTKWSEAEQFCKKITWENTQLETSGDLSSYLHLYHHNEYQKWNQLVEEAKKLLSKKIYPTIEKFQIENQLDILFFHSVSWDLLNAVMEETYSVCNHKQFFYRNLLEIYKAGHFPCGWKGKYPAGFLYVF